MKQRNIKHEKRLKKLILTCLLLAVVLTVGTYAWFIGMQTVSVEAFEVEIAAVEDLALSLDGGSNESKWSSAITISEDILKNNTYAKTTSSWTKLKPVSTVGEVENGTNKLVMYDKGSLTATDGGYRLLAAKVQTKATDTDEDGETISGENDGYVAFDLFIKNMSGDAYYEGYTNEGPAGNEEAIYLLDESSATEVDAGSTASGIENSVRVAFAQIGRAKSDKGHELFQAISCATKTDVTVICDKRLAAIWEPNDTKHNANAIKWYQMTCKQRSNDGSFAETAIGCHEIEDESGNKLYNITDGTYFQTYAVSNEITEANKVDVYDGLNGYNSSISNAPSDDSLLVGIDTFRDSEKTLDGVNRNPIFYLAPNSVTKVRVYIYLEGQDVDNYDFASLGKKIKLNFGFTKERFISDDIEGLKGTPVPGAENAVKLAEYTATGKVTEITTTLPAENTKKAVYDANTKAFWAHKDAGIKGFTFKDGETEKTATYDETDGWKVQ